MDIVFGNRLGEMVIEKELFLLEVKEMLKFNIYVEEIVFDMKLVYV